jgi:hypothetical protein
MSDNHCPVDPEIAASVRAFQEAGFRVKDVRLERTPSARGALSVGGNVLAGGIVGVAVDTASGAAYHHEPNPVIATLEQCVKDEAPGDCSKGP